jgi:hypothetical protein
MMLRCAQGSGLLLILLVSCATAPPAAAPVAEAPAPAPHSEFPSKEELRDLTAIPPPGRIFDDKMVDAVEWTLTGPLPDAVSAAAHEDDSPWFRALAERIAAKPGLIVATEAMYCMARETALFQLAQHGPPTPELQSFIALRCGVADPFPSVSWVTGEVPAKMKDAAVHEQWERSYEKLLDGIGPGNRSVGVWFGRDKGHAIVVVASAERRAYLESTAMVPDGSGRVRLRGELLIPAASIKALAIQGRWGVGNCAVDPSATLPRFSFVCEPHADVDGSARIDVEAYQAGRILGDQVLSVLTRPQGSASTEFARPTKLEATPVSDPATFRTRFLALLNDQRRSAGLRAFALAAEESDTVTRAAPYFFAAQFNLQPVIVMDKVALGVCAGWDLAEPIQHGDFASGVIARTRDVGALIAFMLERPTTRQVLLSKEGARIALGPVIEEGGAFGTVVGVYTLAQADDLLTSKVLEGLNAARKASNAGPVARLEGIDDVLAAAAQEAAAGGQKPDHLLKSALDVASGRLNGNLRGWWMQAGAIDRIPFPAALLEPAPISVALAAVPFRPKGHPWTGYLVIVVTQETTRVITAERDTGSSARAD